ncbi:MAG: XdhC family protein [Longimicrobiales bacterium]|nr:XdhC family protein [Longimicrobiales bacterium]
MNEDEIVYRALVDAGDAGRRVVLATVIEARGSTPRDVGSKMVIGAGDELVGTIGGGCGEADVLEVARRVLETGKPARVRVELTDDEDSWSPAVCGGVMEVFVEPVEPDVE